MFGSSTRIRHFASTTIVFILLVVFWIYAIPGYVAKNDKVLSSVDIAQHLTGDAQKQWVAYEKRRDAIQISLDSLDTKLASGGYSAAGLSAMMSLRRQYTTELNERPPIVLVGMVGNWLNEIWAISYLALGCLVALWGYPRLPLRISRVGCWLLFLYVLPLFQLWARNHWLTSPSLGRTTYWFVNWDMSKSSYILQDLRQSGMFLMVCLFWEIAGQRLRLLRDALHIVHTEELEPIPCACLGARAFKRAAVLWQVSTLLILVIFVPWTFSTGIKSKLVKTHGIYLQRF